MNSGVSKPLGKRSQSWTKVSVGFKSQKKQKDKTKWRAPQGQGELPHVSTASVTPLSPGRSGPQVSVRAGRQPGRPLLRIRASACIAAAVTVKGSGPCGPQWTLATTTKAGLGVFSAGPAGRCAAYVLSWDSNSGWVSPCCPFPLSTLLGRGAQLERPPSTEGQVTEQDDSYSFPSAAFALLAQAQVLTVPLCCWSLGAASPLLSWIPGLPYLGPHPGWDAV